MIRIKWKIKCKNEIEHLQPNNAHFKQLIKPTKKKIEINVHRKINFNTHTNNWIVKMSLVMYLESE